MLDFESRREHVLLRSAGVSCEVGMGTATGSKILYEFGPFRVDPDKQLLLRENRPVAITPKVFETLLILVRHSREAVSKDELMKELWPDTFVEEANLSQNIFMLRKALGDAPDERRYIVTLPGRGYRFASEVRTITQEGGDLVIANRTRSELVLESTNGSADAAISALSNGTHPRFNWRYAGWTGALIVASSVGVAVLLPSRRPTVLGAKDTVLIADFTNATGDPVFDGTLRQGLSVQLEQSPFLSLVSDNRIRQTLRMMGQKPDAKLTPDIALDLCQRVGSAAVVEGSVAQIGAPYLLTVRAINCSNGETLASAEAQASNKNHVLNALGDVSAAIRSKLGESLGTVREFDTPLERATTPSLEALKAYSEGMRAISTGNDTPAAIPFMKRAIELDPRFALAYAMLSIQYTDLGESSTATDYARKAYELRAHTSEPEKYLISSRYDKAVTGNIPEAIRICQSWISAYPRSWLPHSLLAGAIYPVVGEYEKAVTENREAIRLDPNAPAVYDLLMTDYIALDRLDEAKATYELARERKLSSTGYGLALYEIAFLQHNAAEMAREVAASVGQPGTEDQVLASEAETAAYEGQLKRARDFSSQAMNSARREGEQEPPAIYLAMAAVREALFHNAQEARRRAASALGRSTARDVMYAAALTFTFAGDDGRTEALLRSLSRKYPEDTLVQFNFLPTLRARLALTRQNAPEAIAALRAAKPYESGVTTFSPVRWIAMYPVYVRGEAYLAAHRGAEAAGEFEKILDHPGIVVNEPIGALAHLQLGRAYTLEGQGSHGADADAARAKASAAYQDFLALWKNADPDIPIFKQAKAEYARLRSREYGVEAIRHGKELAGRSRPPVIRRGGHRAGGHAAAISISPATSMRRCTMCGASSPRRGHASSPQAWRFGCRRASMV